ncbi:MAG: glycosyltransferase, partial [Planctomycetota bacterium]
MIWIVLIACVLASAIPLLMIISNLKAYLPPPAYDINLRPQISILIPARNEEGGIEAAIRSALTTENSEIEVVVLDDHSEDNTAAIVSKIAMLDSRVRLENAPELPSGWCGKQHACHVLSQRARYEYLLFQDADVRLKKDCALRLVAFMEASKAELVSGIPWQETGTWSEKMLIPLIHFVLLCFLPIKRMRMSTSPAFAAGCGQLFLAKKYSYEAMGGHASIKQSLHDGITLPRAYRKNGMMTDLCDVTELAECRMYRGFGQVWFGLAKNATEGMAKPFLLTFFTIFLLVGQVIPFGIVGFIWYFESCWGLRLVSV